MRAKSSLPTVLREEFTLKTVAKTGNILAINTHSDRTVEIGLLLQGKKEVMDGGIE